MIFETTGLKGMCFQGLETERFQLLFQLHGVELLCSTSRVHLILTEGGHGRPQLDAVQHIQCKVYRFLDEGVSAAGGTPRLIIIRLARRCFTRRHCGCVWFVLALIRVERERACDNKKWRIRGGGGVPIKANIRHLISLSSKYEGILDVVPVVSKGDVMHQRFERCGFLRR